MNNLGSNDEIDINNDLEKEITVLTPKNPQIEASFETISMFFDNYDDLDNQIIDIYKPGIDKLIPYQRFVVHDQNLESELQEVNQISTLSGEVNKGDFEKMFTKNSKSSTFKINVPLGMYSVVHSSIVNQKLHTFSSPKAVSVDFCSDRVAPTISGNIPKIANPVLFQDIDLDLNNSTDIGSRISNLSVNYKDQPFFLNLENPTFDIPKVESEVLDKITIQAVDLAGNQSKVEINPKLQDLTIVLDKVSDTNILGKIVPEVSEGNVTILKSNQDRLIPIQTNPVENSSFEFNFADNPNLQITDNKNRPILEVEDNNLLINDPSLSLQF